MKKKIDISSLLSFHGDVRKSTTAGNPPASVKLNNVDDNDIMPQQLWTTAFACCFHTNESHAEIHQLLMNIRKKMGHDDEDPYFVSSFRNLYQNLVWLHDKLPGEPTKKAAKIYWNKAVEEKLIPCLFRDTYGLSFDNMLLILTSGEITTNEFQAQQMLPDLQLQFVNIDKPKVMDLVDAQADFLLKELMGEDETSDDLISETWQSILKKDRNLENLKDSGDIMSSAFTSTTTMFVYVNLQPLKAQSRRLEMGKMTREEQIEILAEVFSHPSKPKKHLAKPE